MLRIPLTTPDADTFLHIRVQRYSSPETSFFFLSLPPTPHTPPSHPVDADTEVRQEQPGSPPHTPHPHPSVRGGWFDNKFLNFMDSLEFPGTLRSRSILGWRHKEAPSMLSGRAGRLAGPALSCSCAPRQIHADLFPSVWL